MPIEHYLKPADMPAQIPVFPLSGAILLPRSHLPLNIFEPRYLSMVNDAIASDRIIGMIQPLESGDHRSNSDMPELYRIGGAGRIISFSETDDNRLSITLHGISRFVIKNENNDDNLYRTCEVDYVPFTNDFNPSYGEEEVNRKRFLRTFQKYLEAHNLDADWDAIQQSPTENLVNTLSMISPYGLQEKQALLEAENLSKRSEILIALTEMSLAENPDTENPIQ